MLQERATNQQVMHKYVWLILRSTVNIRRPMNECQRIDFDRIDEIVATQRNDSSRIPHLRITIIYGM